jgi:hypothetical protein
MKNHPLYKKLKQIALDRNYTVEQAQALDFNQAAELLETRSFSLTFLINMKYGVIDALRHRDDENDLQQLKQTAKNWLDTNFAEVPVCKAGKGGESWQAANHAIGVK